MDDPWANAWGESSNSSSQPPSSLNFKQTRNNVDSEADISMPSWSTGPAVKWAEPTFGQGSLWGSAEESPGKLWSAPSPYEEINLGGSLETSLSHDKTPSPPQTPRVASPPPPESPKPSQDSIEASNTIEESTPIDDAQNEQHKPTTPEPEPVIEEPEICIKDSDVLQEDSPSPPERASPPPIHSRPPSLDLHTNAFAESPFDNAHLTIDSRPPEPASPDGFGSFETGLDSAEGGGDPWAAPITTLTEDPVANTGPEAWASWGSETPNTADSVETEDEWEAAKRQKEMMDRHVPPHVLAGILREFTAFSEELWPKDGSAPTGLQQGWQSGIEGVDGLTEQIDRLAPKDMSLSPVMSFTKTFTGKKLGETLRLTRNLPSTRSSPFNLYLVSKGSTAWETSVKARIEMSEDDVLPAGWRVVEKEEPVKPVEDLNKRRSGFLSFFGRRTTEDTSAKKTMASVVGSSAAMSSASSLSNAESARKSVESSNSNKPPTRPVTPAVTPASSLPLAGSSNQSLPSPITNVPPQPSLSSAASDEFGDDITPQPQNAVSRFLTRFSRPKSTHSRSPSESMVLSTDDMDFLSEVVPSVSDEFDELDQQKGLATMLSSKSTPSKLPPILPPPPRVSGGTTPTTPTFNITPSKPTFDDFDDDIPLGSRSRTSSAAPTPPSKSNPPSRQPSMSATNAMPDFSIFDMPVPSSVPRPPAQPSSNSSSRSASPFALPPPPKFNGAAPQAPRKAPVAIMSTGSQKPAAPAAFAPILPPPPSRTSSTSAAASNGLISRTPSMSAVPAASKGGVVDDFSDFFSSPPRSVQPNLMHTTPNSASFDAGETSLFSDFSDNQRVPKPTLKNRDSFDDFDDWAPTSGSLRTPSPPKVPAKPPSYGQRPVEPMQPLQPMFSGGTPSRPGSTPAQHQRVASLSGSQGLGGLGEPMSRPVSGAGILPPPPGSGNISRPSSTAPGILPSSPSGSSTSRPPSIAPGILPPPGGAPRIALLDSFSTMSTPSAFSGATASRTSSPAPAQSNNVQPLIPAFDMFSAPSVTAKPPAQTILPKLAKAPSLQSSASQGPLSAQDLSFFEGL